MAVLYRKYRPQIFAEVVDQKPIIQTLQNQVKAGSVAHAYLFTGSRGVGKTSVARILAKAVNCVSLQDGDACGKCNNCKAIEDGNFLDLVEVDAASNTGVDNIRELIEHVRFSPSQGRYKVFIIDEVHMLSKGAFNALLKTLEEPPRHAIFILATTEINKVPATIISRTQRFDFKALPAADILEHLKGIVAKEQLGLDAEILELVATNADGSVRDSLSLLGKVATLGKGASLAECQQLLGVTDISTCEDMLELIQAARLEGIPPFFEKLSERGADYTIFTRDFLEYARKVLIYKISAGRVDFSFKENRLEKIRNFAESCQAGDIIFIIRLFLKAYKDLSFAPFAQIPPMLAAVEAALKKTPPAGSRPSAPVQPAVLNEVKKNEILSPGKGSSAGAVDMAADKSMAEIPKPTITLEEVKIFLPQVIARLKELNGPLASLVRNAKLLEVENNGIIFGVKYQFSKENLESAKNSSQIQTVIEEISGKKVFVGARVNKAEKDERPATEILSQALQVFGGELVE